MATVRHQFLPGEAQFLGSEFPQYKKVNGSNFPVDGLYFDDGGSSTAEAAFWRFLADAYASGNVTLDLYWYADTASSGDVVWDAQLSAITPETDTQDIETDGLATENTVTDSHLGTTAQRIHKATITLSNLDSLAAGDLCHLRIARDADNASDTLSGDVVLVLVEASYSDS